MRRAPGPTIDEVDFCVVTFKRPRAVERLLRSVAERYPQARVHVADQNERFERGAYEELGRSLLAAGLRRPPRFEHVGFDRGLSAARNRLAESSPGRYKLILDDDFVFTEETRVERFVRLLEAHPDAGVVGGRVTREGRETRYDLTIEVDGATMRLRQAGAPLREHDGIRFRAVDCVLNFALMRREAIARVPWDPELKVVEHIDFFARLKRSPFGVLFTPDVSIDHPPVEHEPDYPAYRRRAEFVTAMMRKHRLRRLETEDGRIVELDGERLRVQRPPEEHA